MTRRALIAMVVLCAFAWPASAAVSLVQHGKKATNSAASMTFACASAGGDSTCTANVTAGSALVCGAVAGVTAFTFSDNNGGTWDSSHSDASVSLSIGWGIALNHPAGATTITIAFSPDSAAEVFCAEFRGVKTSSAYDGFNSNVDIGTTSHTGGSITTTGLGVVLGVMNLGGVAATIAEDAGWTLVDEDEAAAILSGGMIYQLTPAATFNPSWTTGFSTNTRCGTLGLLADTGGVGGNGHSKRTLLGVGATRF